MKKINFYLTRALKFSFLTCLFFIYFSLFLPDEDDDNDDDDDCTRIASILENFAFFFPL